MSRESDTSSSGPQGHGGAAYPSGTPPYGTRQYPSLHPQGEHDAPEPPDAGEAPKPEEPKTETTLTTRVRINIPGSRPIPPVVMRTPVEDRSSATTPGASGPPAPAGTVAGAPAHGAPAQRDEEPKGATASADQGGKPAGRSGGQGGGEKTSDWFAPRKPPAGPPPSASPGGGRGGPGPSGSGPSGPPPSGPGPSSPPPSGPAGPGAGQRRPGAAPGQDGPPPGGPRPGAGQGLDRPVAPPAADFRPGAGGGPGTGPVADFRPGAGGGPGTGPNPVFRPGPSGPTTGPAEGDMPLTPPPFQQQDGSRQQPPPPGPAAGGPPPGRSAGPYGGETEFGGADERVSSDTLVSGLHVIPPTGDSPFAPGSSADEEAAPRPPAPPAPVPAAPPAKKKGRPKAVLAAAGVVGVLGVAYAAGLLLDHSEVPAGTTVLGVDIGGTTKEEAVDTLDKALGKRVDAPLTVAVGAEKHQLKPSVVGLDVDTETTVREAAGRDYNPVSVIGSLFGGSREAEPAIETDKEKLTAALEELGGTAEAEKDGRIDFADGKAVAIPGKPHKALDVAKSVDAVSQAYRTRAEGGANKTVPLPSSLRQPTIDQADIDRAMKEFAEPAMSGLVTVQTDPAHTISFSPENSLPKFLSMKAVNGKLVDTYDLKALKALYGGVFDGVLIERGDGSKKPVTPQDVAGALREALRSTDPAGRIVTIETAPQ
ncbi:peptidoglycan binding domain-containing protein [Streptomyces sp. NPDC048845]|uniref:peptidoglycan binding domain-containing protein n=1 Tax=Streptomyces sp. NPDC048845 TaxID=3155390 RepID=UPI0034130BB3